MSKIGEFMINKNYLPLSMGFLEHLPIISDNALKVYIYILMTAKMEGKDKGKAFSTIRELANALDKGLHQTYDAVDELRGKYIEYHGAKNQWGLGYFLVLKYKDIPEVAVPVGTADSGTADRVASASTGTAPLFAVPLVQQLIDKKGNSFTVGFIEAWKEMYHAKTGSKYDATSKDYVLVTNLLKKFSEEEIIKKSQILLSLCENSSAWFTKSWMADFTIGKLSCHWNSILKGAGKKSLSERNAEKAQEVAGTPKDE